MDPTIRRTLLKARASQIELEADLAELWEPEGPASESDSVFTDETEDPDEVVVYEVGDIDDGGETPGAIKKGKLTEDIAEALADIQSAAHSLSGVGDALEGMHKAVSCKACKGMVSRGQRRMIEAMMKQRGWTPESHQDFWGRISSADIEKGEPGGHMACVGRMNGKVDDPHAFCAWAEAQATGEWPGEHKAPGR